MVCTSILPLASQDTINLSLDEVRETSGSSILLSQVVADAVQVDVNIIDFLNEDSAYPTLPSICSSISRFISTAYSMGSSFTSGSMKPVTIMADASASDSPRLIR